MKFIYISQSFIFIDSKKSVIFYILKESHDTIYFKHSTITAFILTFNIEIVYPLPPLPQECWGLLSSA
jgi:hypothetical protein